MNAEVEGLIGQLGKKIDAIAAAIEKHEQKLLIQEAPAQELPRVPAEHFNEDQSIGPLPMEVENLEGLPRSGQEHTIINEVRQTGVGVSPGVDGLQDLDAPDGIRGLNGDGVAAINSPADMTDGDMKESWLEMCMKQVDAREAIEAESSIAFLDNLMNEMRRLRGAAVGIRAQISSNTIANEAEIAHQQAEALIEEFMDRDQAQDESNDEEDF